MYRVWGDVEYPVEYGYSSYGNMVTMKTYRDGTNWNSGTWPGGTETPDTTTWQYDTASGQMTNKVYADSSSVGYSYTVDGKLSTRTWARSSGGSHVTTYSYDSDTGELTGIDYSDSTPDIVFTYNRMGQQSAVSDGVGGRGFAYNSEFQLESETITNTLSGLTHTLIRSYSDSGYLGRDVGFSLGSDYGVGYEFDSYGRMNAVAWDVFGNAHTTSYSYVEYSDLVFLRSTDDSLQSTFSYENDRNLITSIENTFGTNLISKYEYGNDVIGRRTNRLDTLDLGLSTNQFAYNSRSELVSALMSTNDYSYSYDPIGNRTISVCPLVPPPAVSVTNFYTANELNQYTAITNGSGRNLSYDADGSLTNDGYWTYTWNCENRLIAVEPITPTNDAKKVEFVYDYQGRRSQKIVSEYTNSAWSVVSTNYFLWDGFNLISETCDLQTLGLSTNFYVWGLDLSGSLQGVGGIGGLLVTIQDDGAYFPFFDANGNICQYADTNGTVVASREYSAYGETISSSGAMVDDFTFWFSTKPLDQEIGKYYYIFRYYDPDLGRWLSRDPLETEHFQYGAERGLRDAVEHAYLFCGNRAMDYVDYLGLTWDMGNWRMSMARSHPLSISDATSIAGDVEGILRNFDISIHFESITRLPIDQVHSKVLGKLTHDFLEARSRGNVWKVMDLMSGVTTLPEAGIEYPPGHAVHFFTSCFRADGLGYTPGVAGSWLSDKQVAIFTDNIPGNDDKAVIIAHELIIHVGLREAGHMISRSRLWDKWGVTAGGTLRAENQPLKRKLHCSLLERLKAKGATNIQETFIDRSDFYRGPNDLE